ncbi:MAG TPA: c-type cytochrome domain-containing protein, partial [Tepidisphaeraceae bacterium]|nr:c-type cytochrome domain-containing protein [Tepidisphaeraceae bacterium]
MKWRSSILVGALLAFSLILGWSLSTHAGTEEPATVKTHIDFVRDIQPIFRENCYKCHGPEKQKAQLRFDSKDSVYAGGQS